MASSSKAMRSLLNHRKFLRDRLICLPTFDRPDGICDFVFQVARDLAHQNVVIILALGENWQGRSGWRKWYQVLGQLREIDHTKIHKSVLYLGLVQFMPLQRMGLFRNLNIWINLTLLNVVMSSSFNRTGKMLWIFHPHDSQALPYFQDSGWHLHYDVVDWHQSCLPDRQKRIETERLQLIKRADSITVLTTSVLNKIKQLTYKKIALVAQGFDIDGFSVKKKLPQHLSELMQRLKRRNKHLVGYFGGVSARLDVDMLNSVIQRSPDIHFLFVGPRQQDESATISADSERDIDKLLQLSNVSYYPAVQRNYLSQLMEQCSALVLPYDMRYEFNQCCFPMKIMEYFYAEKPIVSTSIPSLKVYKGLIHFADSSISFASRLKEVVETSLSDLQKQKARQIVLSQTWKAKLDSVDVYLGKMLRSS